MIWHAGGVKTDSVHGCHYANYKIEINVIYSNPTLNGVNRVT